MALATKRQEGHGTDTGVDLYERDLHAWALDQARRLRATRPDGLDWENLAEEVESLARGEEGELRERVGRLLVALVKWEARPEERRQSWLTEIGVERTFLSGILMTSPSLRSVLDDAVVNEWDAIRSEAPTQDFLRRLPERCPYEPESLLDRSFMPGARWSPANLIDD